MESKFVAALNNSLQYKMLKIFEGFRCTTNLLQWCTKGQDGLDHGGGGLVGKYFMVNKILKEFFKKWAKLAPWMEESI
jgi:hypothetical protein